MFFSPFLFWDPYFWLILVGLAITMWASWNVKSTFNRYATLPSHNNITGKEAAKLILEDAGIFDVTIQETSGELTDFYNPSDTTLNLSEPVYNSSSIAAICVAAHEAGHAIQDAKAYIPMSFRSKLVPIVNFGANLSMPLIILGVVLSFNQVLIRAGILCFALTLLFQIVTLPVEFNASNRALKKVKMLGIINPNEYPAGRKVLFAAALTYVAAALSTFLQLLRLILLFADNDRN